MRIKLFDREYDLPESFAELTIDKYISYTAAFNKPFIERLSLYTGISIEVLDLLTIEAIGNISGIVSFIEKPDLLEQLCEPFTGVDVGLESLHKMERAKKLVKEGGAIAVAEFYTGKKISGGALLEHWQVVQFYYKSLNSFFERFKEMNNHEYSDEEIEAGVEDLDVFGYFPMVVAYGKNRGLTNDQVLALPAIEIYTELLLDYRRANYQKNLQQIQKDREAHFSKLAK